MANFPNNRCQNWWTLAIGVCLAQQDHFLLLSSCSVFTPRHCSAALLDTGAGGWTWILWTGRGLYTNLLFSQDTVGYILLNLRFVRVGVGTLSDLATFRLILLVICHSPCSNRLKLYHITFTCTFKMNLWALPQSRQIIDNRMDLFVLDCCQLPFVLCACCRLHCCFNCF